MKEGEWHKDEEGNEIRLTLGKNGEEEYEYKEEYLD